MSTVNLDDLFNAEPTIQAAQQVITEFKPAAKKGQGQIYEAVIRFIPNPEDPQNKSIVSKNTAFLKNPLTNVQKEVDCPSTVGQPDPIQDTFFALRNSDNPVLKENSKMFSRRQKHASLIQVLNCKSEPGLEGKILVWSYGIKIHEKIYNEMNPPMGTPRNPFNMFTGRPFYVKVKLVSGFNNYDDSQFIDLQNPNDGAMKILIKNSKGEDFWQPITSDVVNKNPKVKELVFNYLKENCPSLQQYEYKDWDDETRQFVNTCISFYSNPQASMAAAAGTMPQGQFMAQPAKTPQVQQGGFVSEMSSNDIPGLQMGLEGTGMAQKEEGGFGASSVPGIGTGEIDNLLNVGSGPAAQPTPPTQGMSLDDVLNGIL